MWHSVGVWLSWRNKNAKILIKITTQSFEFHNTNMVQNLAFQLSSLSNNKLFPEVIVNNIIARHLFFQS